MIKRLPNSMLLGLALTGVLVPSVVQAQYASDNKFVLGRLTSGNALESTADTLIDHSIRGFGETLARENDPYIALLGSEIANDFYPDCDSDSDGAIVGGLIGGAGGYLVGGLLTGFKCGDGACYAPVFGLAGFVAGLWGGLAHDSETCDPN